MKKPNLQRLAQRSKIYLRKASPTILSGLGAAGVIVTSVLAVRATPKALRKIRADSKVNHDGDPEAYSKLEAVRSAWVCYIPTAISGTATIFCIFGANVLNKHQQAALTNAYALLNDSYNKAYAIDVIRRFLNRDYERDGKGGLFTIEHCRYDMRDIEIWYQANWYLDNVR